jgi:cob(I)alamin adenosyltransferase
MKIYSGIGDNGQTVNLSGEIVFKNSQLIHLLGTLDELNCHLGLVKTMLSNDDTWQFSWKAACSYIEKIQKNLMKMMSHVSDKNSEKFLFSDSEVKSIEKEIDRLSGHIPKQQGLIIPGKNIIEAQVQIVRTIARRGERLFFAAKEEHSLCPKAGIYLNRLSDYLFILSQQESLINVNFINQITGL